MKTPRSSWFASKKNARRHGGLVCPRTRRLLLEPLEHRLLLAVVQWDGGPTGDGTSWHEAVNWVGDELPGANDDVMIDAAGDVTITHSTGTTTIHSLVSSNALMLSGGRLDVATTIETDNTITISGGTLANATVADDATLIATANSNNRLDGVTVNGDLYLSTSSAQVKIEGGTTFANAHLSGNYSEIGFAPGQTLTGNILLEGTDSNYRYVSMNGTSGTLTIGPAGSIKTAAGFGGIGYVGVNAYGTYGGTMTLVNQGLISAEASGPDAVCSTGELDQHGDPASQWRWHAEPLEVPGRRRYGHRRRVQYCAGLWRLRADFREHSSSGRHTGSYRRIPATRRRSLGKWNGPSEFDQRRSNPSRWRRGGRQASYRGHVRAVARR